MLINLTNNLIKFMTDNNNLIEQLSNLTVLQVADLVKALESKWGVSAAAPVAAASAGATAAPAAAEQTSFEVSLVAAGEKKIEVMKVVRTLLNLGLAEAKALVDGAPKVVKADVSKEEAAKIKADLEAAGAKVEVK